MSRPVEFLVILHDEREFILHARLPYRHLAYDPHSVLVPAWVKRYARQELAHITRTKMVDREHARQAASQRARLVARHSDIAETVYTLGGSGALLAWLDELQCCAENERPKDAQQVTGASWPSPARLSAAPAARALEEEHQDTLPLPRPVQWTLLGFPSVLSSGPL